MISLKTIYKASANILYLTLIITHPVHAAYFENLSIEDGLSQSTVFAIAQDKHGYIWIGTNSGLNRYDGTQFTQFEPIKNLPNSNKAISDDNIFHINPDHEGHLWISTHNGLNYLNVDTYEVKRYLHKPDDINSLSNNTTRETVIDSNGYIWIATNGGLNRLDLKTDTFKHYKTTDQNNELTCSEFLRAVAIDKTGTLWAGGNEGGLCRFDAKTEKFSAIDYRNNAQESASIGIRSIVTDNEFLWVATVKGLYQYNTQTKQSVGFLPEPNNDNSLPNKWVQKVTKADEDHFWVTTINGLVLINKHNHSMKIFQKNNAHKNSLSSSDTLSVFVDQSGLVWIGTYDSGIDRYNPRQNIFKNISKYDKPGYALSDPAVWSAVNKHGYLWIATSHGLNRYDLNTKKIKHYFSDNQAENSLVDNTIFAIIEGKANDLWLGTRHGLSHFDIKTETFKNFKHNSKDPNSIPFNNIISLFLDKQNRIWLGFYGGGTAFYSLDTKKFKYFSPDTNDPKTINSAFVHKIVQLPNNEIAFATKNGVSIYSSKNQNFKSISTKFKNKPFSLSQASSIKILHDEKVAIGSTNYLAILNTQLDTILKTYSKKDGLDDDYIYAIEEDRLNNIWVSTNRGLSRIDPNSNKVKNFGVSDGLQGHEYNGGASLNDGKYLYFGGFNGLNYFETNQIKDSKFIPPITITGFSKNGLPIGILETNKQIRLSHQDRFFSISFSVMDFTQTEKNLYAYKLEGFDEHWIYSGNRNFASYTNLDGGNYTFKVKGANKYGTWNEEGISLPIQVEPSPWNKWWAYIVYITIIGLVISFITRSKILADSKALSDQMRRMSTTLTQSLNLITIQQLLSEHLKFIFPYLGIKIFLKTDDKLIASLEKFDQQTNSYPIRDESESKILENLCTLKQPLLLKSDNDFLKFGITSNAFRKHVILALPLVTRDTILGATILILPKQFFAFREDRINIAVTLCTQASAALDNAHLFNKTKQLAFYDSLTGLENRQLFKERLELALKSLPRNKFSLAVMFLDLDKFKRINDSLGHDIGDALLIEAAKRLKNCIRQNDTVARIGGDEFTILLTDIKSVANVSTIAKKILGSFHRPILLPRHTISVSTSIGISMAPKDGYHLNALMKNADVAMYKVKEKGRNNFQFFTEEMNIEASKQLNMENDIRRALNVDEFTLFYQPLVDLHTNNITGVEALIRWNHPEKGLLLPGEFLSISEDTGLINPIGEKVLSIAFAQAKQFEKHNFTKIKISVNLSAKQFIYGHLIETIKNLSEQWALSCEWLELEITENILADKLDETIKTLFQLKELGASLAIDDFGTGYSSLSYLKQLPIDTIKIDRSFIKGIPGDNEDTEITSAIIAMAHNLSLKIVAEGVESLSQLEFLKQRECDAAQGYYFHKPIPGDILMELLQSLSDGKVITLHQGLKNKNNSK